jgi:hypothetical protein
VNPGVAFKLDDETEYGGEIYIISFVKKDVFEMVMMTGLQTDYEILKNFGRERLREDKKNLILQFSKTFIFAFCWQIVIGLVSFNGG